MPDHTTSASANSPSRLTQTLLMADPSSPRRLRLFASQRLFSSAFRRIQSCGPRVRPRRIPEISPGLHQYHRGRFYRPFLSGIVLPHAVFFGYVVGVVELFIGISLLIGLWVRMQALWGVVSAEPDIAAWWDAGHGVAVWRYFGADSNIASSAIAGHLFCRRCWNSWGLDRVRH